MLKTFWFILFLLVRAQEYEITAYTKRFRLTAEVSNTKSDARYPLHVLERADPLMTQNGFKLYFLLSESKLLYKRVGQSTVEFFYDVQNFSTIDEKLQYENLDITVNITGGVINDIRTKTVFDNGASKTEVTILCNSSLLAYNTPTIH